MRDLVTERDVPKSRYFVAAISLCILSCVALIIAFSTPHWLESYEYTSSDFVRLGLWSVCFRNYKHPPYHTDQVFDGCKWIFSYKYYDIRGWLQPGWFMCTQALMSCGLLFSLATFCVIGIILRDKMNTFKVFILAVAFVLAALSALTVFLSISVFGSMCFDRSWIQYPNYNYLSWSYVVAIVAFLLEAASAVMLLVEAFYTRRHLFHSRIAYSIPRLN